MMRRWILLAALTGVLACSAIAERSLAATWHQAETNNFLIYSSGSKNNLRKLAETLEDFDALLRIITQLKADPPPDKFRLYLVKEDDDIQRYTAMGDQVAGFYTASPTGTAAFSSRAGKRSGKTSRTWQFTAQQVLFHEYAHHFMHRYFPYSYPPWYVEGFAEYVSTARFKKKKIILGDFSLGRVATLQFSNWLPVTVLMSPVPLALDDEQTRVFYAQSWLLTHYLMRAKDRETQLETFLRLSPSPEDLESAVQSAFGIGTATLSMELNAYYTGTGAQLSVTRIKRLPPEAIPVALTQLPKSADDVLLAGVKLDIGVEVPFQADILADLDQAKKRYPDDYDVLRTWGHGNVLYGDRSAGRDTLKVLAQQNPADARVLFYLGMSHLQDAYAEADTAPADRDTLDQLRLARKYFASAYRADKTHYPTLYHYYLASPKPASEATNLALEEAEYLAPQVAEIRFNLAYMWSQRDSADHKTAATRLLKVLARDPHGGIIASMAAGRLKELESTP